MVKEEYQECLYGFYQARQFAWESKEKQLATLNVKTAFQNLSPKACNKEFRTLHLDFGRQTGNTYWIMRKCCELFLNAYKMEKEMSCFCFFLNHQTVDNFWRAMCEYQKKKIKHEHTDIYTYTFQTMDKGIKHIPNSYAFVDISCMIGQEKLDQIMELDQWQIISLC